MTAAFWETRSELTLIRDFAHSRMLSADAVLAAVLARITVLIPPTVMLPAIVATRSPLSTYFGIVSPSGGGKTSAWLASGELIGNPPLAAAYAQVGLGSGEGIIEQLKADEDGHRDVENLLVEADEIGAMTTLIGRTGSNLAGNLKTAWSGGLLHNANRHESGKVEAHTYNIGMFVGVQPRAAHELLQATGDGFFQRFVFFRGNDASVPDDCREPDERINITIPPSGDLVVCGPIRERIRQDRLAAVRNTELGDVRTNSHRNLIRLRLSALLSILRDGNAVDWSDWELAGSILDRSDELADGMRSVVAQSAQEMATARAVARLNVVDSIELTTFDRAKARIIERLSVDEWTPAAKVRKGLTASLRGSFDGAVDALESSGEIEVLNIAGQGTPGRILRIRGGIASPPPPPENTGGDTGDGLSPVLGRDLASDALHEWERVTA
ncbi:hypothetical protein GCM10027568_11070 [Humibacter soli]